MTDTVTPAPSTARRLRHLGNALDARLQRLQNEYLAGSPRARAELAKLRRAVGKPAGSDPDVWETTLAAVPEALQGRHDEPNRAEQAIHAALTLFATHQQSMPGPAHQPGVSFGRAVKLLSDAERRSKAAVTRRFMAVATAQSMDEVLIHVRGLVTQLRSERRGFDYARFADDLIDLLNPESADRVRLAWGRDFYRTNATTTNESTHPDNTQEQQP